MPLPTRRQREQALKAMLDGIFREVDALPGPLLGQLAPVLAQAQRELERDLRAWFLKQDGAERFTAQRLRSALIGVRRSMEAIREIEPVFMAGLRIGANAAGALATGHLQLEYERLDAIYGLGQFEPVVLNQAAIMARGERLLLNRFRTSVRRYTTDTRALIARELAVGQLKRETVSEVAARLMSRVPAIERAGQYSAERIARTELMNAYNAQHEIGLRDMAKQDPAMLMRWDASRDRRTCVICLDLDGSTTPADASKAKKFVANYKLTVRGRATKRKMTADRPPIHPNDRCVLTPWHPDWGDPKGLL